MITVSIPEWLVWAAIAMWVLSAVANILLIWLRMKNQRLGEEVRAGHVRMMALAKELDINLSRHLPPTSNGDTP